MEKKIIIIGAGIAGLCAGCYARMNGYPTTIFELHNKPGGLCTSWKRKDYVVDGCIHWLVGSGPGNALHQGWKELGALDRKFVDHEELARVQGPEGKEFIFYTDIDRLEKHLLELSPADEKMIRDFANTVRRFTRFPLSGGKPRELQTLGDRARTIFRMRPLLWPFLKWSKVSLQEFAGRFQDPFLRKAFPAFFDLPDFPMIALLFTLAWFHQKTSGYPIGGSLEFIRGIEKRYLGLGGEIRYRSRVEKILVENDRAVGVRLADGSEHQADLVISAGDGHHTIFELLEGKYLDEEIRGYYEKLPRFPSLIQVSFGVNRDFSPEPPYLIRLLPEPIEVAGVNHKALAVHNYSFDPTLAPPGKTVVVMRLEGDYQRWKELKKDPAAYEAEKQKVADTMLGFLETLYPGVSEQVEMVDVATPLTYERYTHNWQGCMEGWLITRKSMMMRMKRTLPGLENFYMIGQWVAPGGGLPSGLMTGREVIQLLCHRDGKTFTTSLP